MPRALSEKMEVFQDLMLKGPTNQRGALRHALMERSKGLWRHAPEREAELDDHGLDTDVLVFNREAADGVPAGSLFLWGNEEGYSVTNIVPIEVGEIGESGYNAILQDFERTLARPAAEATGYTVAMTSATQSIDDWLAADVAGALRRFSALANKSTGSSHPLDRERWFKFCILAHSTSSQFDTTQLVRWLVQVEGWSYEKAEDLALDYEYARDLLKAYDTHRPV